MNISNELRNYKQAVYIFRLDKDRLPGDLDGSGKIGYSSGQTYTSSSFPAPYDGTDENYPFPNAVSAPFIDLYLAQVIDFKPKGSYNGDNGDVARANGVIPGSKSFKDTHIKYQYLNSSVNTAAYNYLIYGNYVNIRSLKGKIAEKVDRKLDDSVYNTGIVRGQCSSDTASYSTTTIGCGIFLSIDQ